MEKELSLVTSAIKINTLSKLTFSDSKKFEDLLQDVFPGTTDEQSADNSMMEALEESCKELGLQLNQRQVNE